jgi:NAD(P)-dependent dehydrogenase (short-subunit alcohol dehydrogenase family)
MTTNLATQYRVALVTGGSAGLGRALVLALHRAGWTVVTDARHQQRFEGLPHEITTIPGDITDAAHRDSLVAEVRRLGRLDLLVHNASSLGPTPLPRLENLTIENLTHVWRPNVGAPLVLTSGLLPFVRASGGTILSISSDAAIEHDEGWGLYGASKAALEHLTLQYAAENPGIRGYALDPGDMRTDMHQAAFPGEDISDRPLPESVIPAILDLIESGLPSGRYRAADLTADRAAS